MNLHPSVRIVVLVALAAGMAAGDWAAVVVGLVVVFMAGSDPAGPLAGVLHSARRLRWLLLSIAVFYGWFSTATFHWLPDAAALSEGARRAAILLVMALGARRLLGGLARERTAAALLWLVAPLARIGLPVQRFAVRLVLVFDRLAVLGAWRPPRGGGSRWRRIAAAVAGPLDYALKRAENEPLPELTLPSMSPPPARDWLVACAVAAALWLG
ncbi:hypothetical protein [Arhodomonas aquaeolei]|uniref:hypothetical protein n=1 Tax=Arhodomonas aquaeolei TaxID=2369 RepID=UPI000367DE90|nr:hypothetical protein [Arhodomonas aquaeolei]